VPGGWLSRSTSRDAFQSPLVRHIDCADGKDQECSISAAAPRSGRQDVPRQEIAFDHLGRFRLMLFIANWVRIRMEFALLGMAASRLPSRIARPC